jgi:hypothetical protein
LYLSDTGKDFLSMHCNGPGRLNSYPNLLAPNSYDRDQYILTDANGLTYPPRQYQHLEVPRLAARLEFRDKKIRTNKNIKVCRKQDWRPRDLEVP